MLNARTKKQPRWIDKHSREYRRIKTAEFIGKVVAFERINKGEVSEGEVYDYARMLHAIHYRGLLDHRITERFNPEN